MDLTMSLGLAIPRVIVGDNEHDSHVHRNRVDVPRVESSEFRARNTVPHQAECSSSVIANIASREKY
ncbi:hypothetical protein X777_13530 [Ooceraea biroi]|uniref:Uncharacterized protein n=1 Tax=Ooceraea biroi TaxID=2015173 RepID=A0A026WXH2_OOCBI|nr:hypothetical protein X777_13530 [Ooceraea biroi]